MTVRLTIMLDLELCDRNAGDAALAATGASSGGGETGRKGALYPK